MSGSLPNFRDWDNQVDSRPYGWDYGHGNDRKRVTFKTKKEKQEYRKAFENRWYSERHAVLSFDADRWRKYLELERRLEELGSSIESAVNFYIEHSASRKAGIPKFSELYKERIDDLEKQESDSISHARIACSEFMAKHGDKAVNLYTRGEVQESIDDVVKAGWSRSKCENHLKHIRVIFTKALVDGHIDRMPTIKIRLPSGRGEKRLKLIDPADLRKLLEYTWGYNKSMVGLLAILFFTGMRSSMIAVPPKKRKEREFLRLDMINRDAKTIVIPAGITKSGVELIIDDAPECMWSWLDHLKASDFGMAQNTFNLHKNNILNAVGVKWPSNLHRRSFGSYLAALRGKGYASRIMGDRTESVFVKHYQVPAFKKTALEYVGIFKKT